ncbi:uncharacterized protein B0I36DRAFT_155472 [Microdochium trichocladiopsis]|uniref:Uncharacterized protein n=1 Tax=Microdochium trichocladiopsis TaxID=1682393 RepID=A0A9P8XZV9_9PEZI|nr:uncharacterized protein B0I36DRAFT_155472 [Microdochium trichocladiopsis]KAH7026224.1 hypothetical protein B0I36DRAFT_155472 [Microdochium trichocladiopsis]
MCSVFSGPDKYADAAEHSDWHASLTSKRALKKEGYESEDLLYIHEKRRRLLQTGDWTGVNRQIPVAVDFERSPARNRIPGWNKKVSSPQAVGILRASDGLNAATRYRGFPQSGLHPPSESSYRIHIGSHQAQRQYAPVLENDTQQLQAPSCSSTSGASRRSSSCVSSLYGCRQHRLPGAEKPEQTTASARRQPQEADLGQQGGSCRYSASTRQSRDSSLEGHLPHITYSSSVIHVPVPHRHARRFDAVLDWSPTKSDNAPSSVEVEIGDHGRRMVTHKQQANEASWRSWLDPSSCSPSSASPSLPPHISISPGISELPSLMALELPEFDSFCVEKSRNRETFAQPKNDRRVPDQRMPETIPTNASITAVANNDATVLLDFAIEQRRLTKGQEQKVKALTKQERDDLDNRKWMGFLFDGDENSSDIVNNALDEATFRAAQVASRRDQVSPKTPAKAPVNNPFHETSSLATCGTKKRQTVPVMKWESEACDALSPQLHHSSLAAMPHSLPSSPEPDQSSHENVSMAENATSTEDKLTPKPLFTMPSTFVGKLAVSGCGPGPALHKSCLPLLSSTCGAKRGRRKRKALDGRPEIRNLPDFDGDPIEES